MNKVSGTKTKRLLAAALVLTALLFTATACSGSDSGLTGKWSCSEIEISENTFQPRYITLNFYDMKGGSGWCTLSYEMGTYAQTVRVSVSGNQLTFTTDDGGTETYEITWHGSGSFTLTTPEGKMLFTKK